MRLDKFVLQYEELGKLPRPKQPSYWLNRDQTTHLGLWVCNITMLALAIIVGLANRG